MQSITIFPIDKEIDKESPEYPYIVKKRFNYNTIESLDYPPIFFDHVKYLGNSPMHKKLRPPENVFKLSEHKHARANFPALYFGHKTEAKAIALSHQIFKDKFKERLGVKYFVPEPASGGNSNNGPMMKKVLDNPHISADILGISPVRGAFK